MFYIYNFIPYIWYYTQYIYERCSKLITEKVILVLFGAWALERGTCVTIERRLKSNIWKLS